MSHSHDEWVALGRQAILQLLDAELAVVPLEIEARISDQRWGPIGERVEPHALNEARQELQRRGDLVIVEAPTRGGRDVPVLSLDRARRKTATDQAAARKRLLMTRYLGWASGTPSRPGIIGPAAERVVYQALAAANGYVLERPEGGPVSEFLGKPVPLGPLDNAAHLVTLTAGIPTAPIAVPVEVKNVRDWLYPSNVEPYQLLDKAARMQAENPDTPIAPVLVCRRAHMTLFRMARDLGFFIIMTRLQYIGAVDEERLTEVRSGLGFIDLVYQPGRDAYLDRQLARTFTARAPSSAERWQITAEDDQICRTFTDMRLATNAAQRSDLVIVLRYLADQAGLYAGGW